MDITEIHLEPALFYDYQDVKIDKIHSFTDVINYESKKILAKKYYIRVEETGYYYRDEFHRLGGPAIIVYYLNGAIKQHMYFINGNLHRTDGPAAIYYDKIGRKRYKKYYIDGEHLSNIKSDKQLKHYLKSLILK